MASFCFMISIILNSWFLVFSVRWFLTGFFAVRFKSITANETFCSLWISSGCFFSWYFHPKSTAMTCRSISLCKWHSTWSSTTEFAESSTISRLSCQLKCLKTWGHVSEMFQTYLGLTIGTPNNIIYDASRSTSTCRIHARSLMLHDANMFYRKDFLVLISARGQVQVPDQTSHSMSSLQFLSSSLKDKMLLSP